MITSTIVTQLRALERMTRTEVSIARIRGAQARTDAVRRELAQNATTGERRAARIAAQLTALDAVPDVLSPPVARLLSAITSTVEQAQPVEEALLHDLSLEHQLLDRARYVRTLAGHAGRSDVAELADDLVTAHTATVEWITTVLAEHALGGPAALHPTPLQRVAGGVSRAAGLPARVAMAGFNRAVHVVVRAGENARDAIGNAESAATRIGADAIDIAVAGRDGALRRTEQLADREGAHDVAGSVHTTRRDLGTLSTDELPVRGYAELTAPNAIGAIRKLTMPDDINAVLAFEENHRNRTGVVSAAQAHYAAVAKDIAGIR